jgi:hypothetical protein
MIQKSAAEGRDLQLERAIAELMKRELILALPRNLPELLGELIPRFVRFS